MANRSKRYRKQYKFWLDLMKDDERVLAEVLHELKENRQYSATLRDALKLYIDLLYDNTDQLREQFPHILKRLQQHDELVHRMLQEIRQQIDTLPTAPVASGYDLQSDNAESLTDDDDLGDDLGDVDLFNEDVFSKAKVQGGNADNLLGSLLNMEDD